MYYAHRTPRRHLNLRPTHPHQKGTRRPYIQYTFIYQVQDTCTIRIVRAAQDDRRKRVAAPKGPRRRGIYYITTVTTAHNDRGTAVVLEYYYYYYKISKIPIDCILHAHINNINSRERRPLIAHARTWTYGTFIVPHRDGLCNMCGYTLYIRRREQYARYYIVFYTSIIGGTRDSRGPLIKISFLPPVRFSL